MNASIETDGKSTTVRVLVGLDAPDAGTATIGGRPYRTPRNPLRHVGLLLGARALQPSGSARSHLLWLAHSQGLSVGRVDEVIAAAGLESAARPRAAGLPRHAAAARHRRAVRGPAGTERACGPSAASLPKQLLSLRGHRVQPPGDRAGLVAEPA